MDIAAYVPGKSHAPAGVAKVHKLSSNETPLGASPAAIEAVKRLAEKMEFYPDGSATRLREAIGAAYGLNPANIVCSNGSDEIIGLLAQTYLTPGDEGIFTEHGFAVYRIYIQAAGGVPVVAEETDERADVDAILAKVTRTDPDRLPCQSQQSDRHLPAVRGGAPAACGLAPARAAGDRRGLCRICPPQRLRIRHRAGVVVAERRHDPHLLQGARARRHAHRLGLCAGRISSMR